MTYPRLPDCIPACALRQGWTMRPIDPLRRTEMDDQFVSVDRVLARLAGIQTLSWEMCGEAFDVLVAFWAQDLDAGSRWFYAPIVEGSRTCQRLVRMSGSPPWQGVSPANGVFSFSFEAELRELPLLTFGERAATELWLEDRTELDGLIIDLGGILEDMRELYRWN